MQHPQREIVTLLGDDGNEGTREQTHTGKSPFMHQGSQAPHYHLIRVLASVHCTLYISRIVLLPRISGLTSPQWEKTPRNPSLEPIRKDPRGRIAPNAGKAFCVFVKHSGGYMYELS